MPLIKEKKLLYHLTSLTNIKSVLKYGLKPRSALKDFHDVADKDILKGRAEHGLDDYVPFHWFSRNPFDGRVQKDRPGEQFVLVTVRRTLAEGNNWKILPRHPLSRKSFEIYDYEDGFDIIDWDLMQRRDYRDAECKSVCMAECLSPSAVLSGDFFKIYVPTENISETVSREVEQLGLSLEVTVNPRMFG
jgi:hypothetical protein|tara:strand:- start:2839 stop:3408 length:570 start_codon:yes stop_codon:yes gene_type:complete